MCQAIAAHYTQIIKERWERLVMQEEEREVFGHFIPMELDNENHGY